MKRIGLIFLIGLTNIFCLGQSTNTKLRGWITEQSSGNKPIQQAQIKADFANATISDNKGKFLLQVYKMPPGADIILSLVYKDWVVVNEKDLTTQLPYEPDKHILKIYMCPSSRLAQNRMEFYNISEKNITAQYAIKLRKLNREKNDFASLAKQLADERNMLLKQSYELADQLARINFDDISENQKQAFEQFKLGNLQEAIKILESVNSTEIIKQAQKEKQKWMAIRDTANVAIAVADSALQHNIQKLMFQAQLYDLNFQFDSAETAYEHAVLADTAQANNIIEFAKFLLVHVEYDKSITWYSKALKLSITASDKSSVFTNLGMGYVSKNDFANAEEAYINALKIADSLVAINQQNYDPVLAFALSRLGFLYQQKNEFDSAENTFLKLLEIAERRVKRDPQKYKQTGGGKDGFRQYVL